MLTDVDPILDVAGRGYDRAALERLATADAATRAGRFADGMTAVAFSALVAEADVPSDVTHATFHASDGYAASVPVDTAARDAVIVVPSGAAGRTGVRLVVADGSSNCFNVKAVERVAFDVGPGRHTVDPNPHQNAAVPGWDDRR